MPKTPERQRLGDELRRIRTLAGKSQAAVAESSGGAINDQVTVSRIENGSRAPSLAQAEAWFALTDAATRARAMVLLDATVRMTRSWDEVGPGGSLQADADRDVRMSRLCRTFQVSVVPGLLQLPETARAVFVELGSKDPAGEAAKRIARQDALYDAGRQFRLLMTERVLDCAVAPHVRAAQLRHVASVAESLDAVEIGILPERHNVGVHSFTLYTPESGDGVFARVELIDKYRGITSADAVMLYEQVWSQLWATATTGPEAIALVRAST